MTPFNNLRMELKEALDNLWSRIRSQFEGLDSRVKELEEHGGGDVNVIEAISFNGSNIPPDASKRVSLNETDPTVPTWAKAATKPAYTAAEVGAIPATAKGSAGGVAELDSGGKVPSAQLPSYVDDVLEYSTAGAFPATGETGKIYVATDTNLTYRWTGSGYIEIAGGLALGETSSTAYRGDRGKYAYDHAQAHGSAYASGLYLIQTNAEGHVIAATPVQKSDITALGIPGENLLTGVKGNAERAYRTGNVNLTPANLGLGSDKNAFTATSGVSSGNAMGLRFVIDNPNNALNNHSMYFIIQNQNIALYDYTDGAEVWHINAYNTRVKGNAENNYRIGDVNLTPENIGAPSMLSLSGKPVSFNLPLNHYAIGVIGNNGVCSFWHAGNTIVAYGLNTNFAMTYSGDTVTIDTTLSGVNMGVLII